MFTSYFEYKEWVDLLDDVARKMPHLPDFVVLPDVFNNAEQTIEWNRRYLSDVREHGLKPAAVVQPGVPVAEQVSISAGLGAKAVLSAGSAGGSALTEQRSCQKRTVVICPI